jgi:Zn-dependent metalloprotease
MVFGDGDGRVFTDFTKSLDVIAHELAHGVTEHAAGLEYHTGGRMN